MTHETERSLSGAGRSLDREQLKELVARVEELAARIEAREQWGAEIMSRWAAHKAARDQQLGALAERVDEGTRLREIVAEVTADGTGPIPVIPAAKPKPKRRCPPGWRVIRG